MKKAHVFLGSILILAAIAFTGCGVSAHVEKDPSVNLNDYKTFAWIADQGESKKEGKSYQNFQEKILKDMVNEQLQKNGWRQVRSNADVLVDYDIMVENDVKNQSESVYSRPTVRYFYNPYTRRINSVYYPSQYLGENSYAVPYRSGTITLNFVDTKSNNLVWQGWAETELTSRRLQQDDMKKVVKAIFKKFNADVASR
jgi:Domain of unknown function (DUF4136)